MVIKLILRNGWLGEKLKILIKEIQMKKIQLTFLLGMIGISLNSYADTTYLKKNRLFCTSKQAFDNQNRLLANNIKEFAEGCYSSAEPTPVVLVDNHIFGGWSEVMTVKGQHHLWINSDSVHLATHQFPTTFEKDPTGSTLILPDTQTPPIPYAPYTPTDICRANVSAEGDTPLKKVKLDKKSQNGIIYLSEPADKKGQKYHYKCKLFGNAVMFMSSDIDFWKEGDPVDWITTYQVKDNKLTLTDHYPDDSQDFHTFTKADF